MKPRIAISNVELRCIDAIAHRAQVWFPDREWRDIMMDLVATHLRNPLRLQDLLDANDNDFIHDITGIERHLDRQTFELTNCFSPRYSA